MCVPFALAREPIAAGPARLTYSSKVRDETRSAAKPAHRAIGETNPWREPLTPGVQIAIRNGGRKPRGA
jgi:hypothetical protein